MPLPTLPLELTDYILSFLRNDKRTLIACSQVCGAWHPASRTYLFDNIRFKTPRSYTLFVEQVLGSRAMLPNLDLVHGIAIVSPDGFMNRYLASKFMRDMHGNLPNLRILRISYVDWGHLVTSDTWKLFDVNMASPFPRLTKLAITHVVLPSTNVFTQLLVSLPSLSNLSLRDVSFRFQGSFVVRQNEAAPPQRSTTLEALWIDGTDDFVTPFVFWFVEQFPEARVRLRELGCTPKRWYPASASLLETLGPTPMLNTLLMPFPRNLEEVERVSLSHLTNLTRLNVLLMGRYPSAASWTDFAHMLESLGRRPGTQSLSIALCFYPAKPDQWQRLDGPGLEVLDPILDRLASPTSTSAPMAEERPGAQAFKFVCYVHQPEGSRVRKCDVDSLVRRKLKISAERGVVSGRLMRTAWTGGDL